jgi:hypothetical protein
MSHVVAGVVQRRKIGSPTRKAVLMYMAGCASDDGSGVWTSKSNMARDLEMGRRTVQNCIEDLLADGFVSVTGTRACSSGLTVEYRVNLEAVSRQPSTRQEPQSRVAGAQHEDAQDVHAVQELHGRCAGDARQAVREVHTNRSGTVLEPSNTDHPAPSEPSDRVPSFSEFWKVWPLKKQARSRAEKNWKTLSHADRRQAVENVVEWSASWQKTNPTANPIHAGTYLIERRWTDDFSSSQQTHEKWRRL